MTARHKLLCITTPCFYCGCMPDLMHSSEDGDSDFQVECECGTSGPLKGRGGSAIEGWERVMYCPAPVPLPPDRSLLAAHALDRLDNEIELERINSAQYIGIVVVEADGSVIFSEGWNERDDSDFNARAVAGGAAQLLHKVQKRWCV